jgi:hypothetical protein
VELVVLKAHKVFRVHRVLASKAFKDYKVLRVYKARRV